MVTNHKSSEIVITLRSPSIELICPFGLPLRSVWPCQQPLGPKPLIKESHKYYFTPQRDKNNWFQVEIWLSLIPISTTIGQKEHYITYDKNVCYRLQIPPHLQEFPASWNQAVIFPSTNLCHTAWLQLRQKYPCRQLAFNFLLIAT